MRSEEELERIFNAVQIAILEKCWKGLDEVAQGSLQKSKVDTSEIHRMIDLTKQELAKYNLTKEEQEVYNTHAIEWGLRSEDIPDMIAKKMMNNKGAN